MGALQHTLYKLIHLIEYPISFPYFAPAKCFPTSANALKTEETHVYQNRGQSWFAILQPPIYSALTKDGWWCNSWGFINLFVSFFCLMFPFWFCLCVQEKEDKAMLQEEVQHLRQDNMRLQEESQTAAAQLRKFTEWFFHTIDKKPWGTDSGAWRGAPVPYQNL